MSEEAPLLNDEADHPHDIVLEHLKGRVVAMDSARYVDTRNEGRDVVVPSSYPVSYTHLTLPTIYSV